MPAAKPLKLVSGALSEFGAADSIYVGGYPVWVPPTAPPFSSDLLNSADPRSGVYSDAGLTAAADGATVRQWTTAAGAATQATAGSRPTYRATGWFGGPCLEFDGGDWMSLPAISVDRRNFTVAVAVSVAAPTSGNQVIFGATTPAMNIFNNGTGGISVFDGTALRAGANCPMVENLVIVRGTASGVSYWYNGNSSTYGQVSSAAALTSGTASGAWSLGGDVGGGTRVGAGTRIGRWAVWNRALSDLEAAEAMGWLKDSRRPPELVSRETTPRLALWVGNSLGAGAAQTTFADSVAQRVQTSLGAAWRTANLSLPSAQTPEFLRPLRMAERNAYLTYGRRNVVVLWEASNHMMIGGVTAAAAYSSMAELVASVQSTGAAVVVGTVLPRQNSSGFWTKRNDYNATLITNAASLGVTVADVAALSTVGGDGDELDTTYYNADQIHLNNTGAGEVAPVFAAAVAAAVAAV